MMKLKCGLICNAHTAFLLCGAEMDRNLLFLSACTFWSNQNFKQNYQHFFNFSLVFPKDTLIFIKFIANVFTYFLIIILHRNVNVNYSLWRNTKDKTVVSRRVSIKDIDGKTSPGESPRPISTDLSSSTPSPTGTMPRFHCRQFSKCQFVTCILQGRIWYFDKVEFSVDL